MDGLGRPFKRGERYPPPHRSVDLTDKPGLLQVWGSGTNEHVDAELTTHPRISPHKSGNRGCRRSWQIDGLPSQDVVALFELSPIGARVCWKTPGLNPRKGAGGASPLDPLHSQYAYQLASIHSLHTWTVRMHSSPWRTVAMSRHGDPDFPGHVPQVVTTAHRPQWLYFD